MRISAAHLRDLRSSPQSRGRMPQQPRPTPVSACKRRTRSLIVAAAALLALFVPRTAGAWLPEGHLATGAIAYDALEIHAPEAVAVVLRLIRSHPEWARFDRDLDGLTGRARERRTFELMAIWPDVARGGPFDHDSWHYSEAFVSSMRHLVPFAFGGAERAFRRNLAVARDPRADDTARAIALCWVMHIVGDMHQPLHAALWISWRFPISDAGGNWAWVRATEDAAPERLHRFWDAAGRPGALSRASPDAFVARLEREHPYEAEAPVVDPGAAFEGWAAHSRSLAFSAVYEHGALRPGTSREAATVLRRDYVERSQAIGADQIAAAGNRIGALLSGLR